MNDSDEIQLIKQPTRWWEPPLYAFLGMAVNAIILFVAFFAVLDSRPGKWFFLGLVSVEIGWALFRFKHKKWGFFSLGFFLTAVVVLLIYSACFTVLKVNI